MTYSINQGGYVALASVLVIAAIVFVIGITAPLASINEVQVSLSGKTSNEATDLLEGCVEDALLRISETNSLPSTINFSESTCSITLNSQSGTTWVFTVTIDHEDYNKSIQVNAIRDTEEGVSVNTWLDQ